WMVLTYLGQLYEPLKTISKKAAGIQSYLTSAERAFGLLDEQPELPERPHARAIGRAAGAVAFRPVSFAYGPDRPVLHDVSLEIEPGTRPPAGGPSGGGKAAVMSLDEPTGSVDAKSAAAIGDERERLKRGRAVIVISHRPSTLAGCSALLTIDGGRVVADTTPAAVEALPTPAPPSRAPTRAL